MKKLLLIFLLILTLPFIVSCQVKPREECITEWEYKMVEKQFVIVSYTTYVLDTEFGDVTVSKKIYENAQNGDYIEICLTVEKEKDTLFIGATLIDGTPIDQTLLEELEDQLIEENEE